MKSSAEVMAGISDSDVERYLSQRESAKRFKRLLERIQESLRSAEQGIIAKLDQGADVSWCSFGLQVKEALRRFPSWKDHFISLAGKEAADRIVETTTPKIYRNLVVEMRYEDESIGSSGDLDVA